MVERFYHIDPMRLCISDFLAHLKQINIINKLENGQNPNEKTPEEMAKAIMSGEVKISDIMKMMPKKPAPGTKMVSSTSAPFPLMK